MNRTKQQVTVTWFDRLVLEVLGVRRLVPTVGMLVCVAVPAFAQQPPATASAPPGEVMFYGNPNGNIASGVVIPGDRASVWISGTTPPVLNADAPAGSRERFGDTKTQAAGILKTVERQLAALGLTMKDVVYIRAYLVPDPAAENKIDTAGWNASYREVFGTATNPTKTARSTVGVVALVNPDWLIEIEAFAVFPTASR